MLLCLSVVLLLLPCLSQHLLKRLSIHVRMCGPVHDCGCVVDGSNAMAVMLW